MIRIEEDGRLIDWAFATLEDAFRHCRDARLFEADGEIVILLPDGERMNRSELADLFQGGATAARP